MDNEIKRNEFLSSFLETHQQQILTLTETNRQLQQLIEKLQLQIEELLRKLYGKKSEKIPATSPEKPADNLVGEDNKGKIQQDTAQKTAKTGGQRRRTLPETLPRQRIEYTLSH